MKFYVETKRYVKIHSETKEVREVYSETKCCFDWKKKVQKLFLKVCIPCMLYAQATSVLKEYDCWVDCVFLRTSLWKVARFTSEWNKFHILELTHQETDLFTFTSSPKHSVILCHWLGFSDVKHSFNLKYRTPAVGPMLCMQTES